MLGYVLRRILLLIPLLFAVSVIAFVIIQLPPGDYLTTYIINLQAAGTQVSEDEIQRLYRMFGLDRPLYVQYFRWIWNIVRYGDFGVSFQWQRPVREVIGERLLLTMVISLCTIIFSWVVGVAIGIYSAVRQYSIFDYVFTFLGFIGLSIPNFLLALILIFFGYKWFGWTVTGLFSAQYVDAPWSLAKVADMLRNLWVPVLIVGTAGTAGLVRVMRGCLLDELRKQYVITARAKGLSEVRLLFKYPVRSAINPLVSTVGWLLPAIISGETITAIVLNLPTTGPVLFRALMSQDMYLAGSFVLILSALAVTGTLVSDILLAWLDPRIRYERRL
mgnify:CR=1 FL=1